MTRNGDEVHLSWKQLVILLFGCMSPAVAFGTALAHWAGRVQVAETVIANHNDRIESVEHRVTSIEKRDGALMRIEQHLLDIDRQLAEIKSQRD